MSLASDAYARMLKQLLPRGTVWPSSIESIVAKTLLAIADELARVGARGDDLINESDPRTATETLEDWERILGLPDDLIVEIPDTDEERRLAITQKLIKRGGQTPALYIALAAAAGYTVTIKEDYGATIFRVGISRVGERLYGAQWAHVWKITVQAPAGAALSHDELEAIINRAKPAHTFVFFEYL